MEENTPDTLGPWMALTKESLQGLPAFVKATVNDYSNGNEEQRWRLREYTFDLGALDCLPVDEDSTLEIAVANGWVWRACTGRISLSPSLLALGTQVAPPVAGEPSNVFAWIVEREQKTGEQHITVWRIRVPREQADRIAQVYPPHILLLVQEATHHIEEVLYPSRKTLETADGATFANMRDLQTMISALLADPLFPEETKQVWRSYYATLVELLFYWEEGTTAFPQHLPAYLSTLAEQQQSLPLAAMPQWVTKAGIPLAEQFTKDRLLRCWWLAGWQTAARAALLEAR